LGFRDDMITHHKGDIDRMKESIRWMEDGTEQFGEVSSSGELVSLNKEMIAHYRRTIEMLEDVVARLEAKEY